MDCLCAVFNTCPQIQLNHYLDIYDGQNCLQFCTMNRNTLPFLFKVGVRLRVWQSLHQMHPLNLCSAMAG